MLVLRSFIRDAAMRERLMSIFHFLASLTLGSSHVKMEQAGA